MLLHILIAIPAVAAAVFGVITKKKSNLFCIISYALMGIMMILSIGNILNRVENNDIAGVLDIVPTMKIIFIVVLALITLLNVISMVKSAVERSHDRKLEKQTEKETINNG